MPVRRNRGALLAEVVLLTPVVSLLVLAGLEIQQACEVHARLSATAQSVASAGSATATEVSSARQALSASLKVDAASIHIAPAEQGRTVTVAVPYSLAGGRLAFLWPEQNIIGTACAQN